jgi:hypothetical protein
MRNHSSNKIKELIIIFYLNDVNVPFSGSLQAAYTEKMKKYAELNTEVKQKWQVGAMYTLPATLSAIEVIPHMLHDVLKRLYLTDLLYVTMQNL